MHFCFTEREIWEETEGTDCSRATQHTFEEEETDMCSDGDDRGS